MNCQLCQKEFESYLRGSLPEGITIQVKAHLESCKACAQSYQLMAIADRMMDEEKSMQSNPFLVTRIMSAIEELEQNREGFRLTPVFQKVLKPFLISASLAAAIFAGVVFGNLSLPTTTNDLPVEMSYMNDAALESVDLFSKL